MQSSYSIIIPAYNEEANLGQVLDNLKDLPGCAEIIVIDDGSIDNTADIAQKRDVSLIQHSFNMGYGASLKTGILAAKTDYVITVDSDGQHRSKDVQVISDHAQQYDMVVGVRDKSSYQVPMRKPGKILFHWFVNYISKRKIPDINSGLRSFKVEVIKKYLHLMPEGFSFSATSTVALIRMNHNIHYTSIHVLPRQQAKSSLRFFEDGLRAFMLVLNLTVLFSPYRIFLPISALFFLAGVITFIVDFSYASFNVTDSMVMFFLTSCIIFSMGIICEQVSAMRREMHL